MLIRRLLTTFKNPNDNNYIQVTFDCTQQNNIRVLGEKFQPSTFKYVYIDNAKKPVKLDMTTRMHTFKGNTIHTVRYVFSEPATDVSYMFDQCTQLTSFDLGHFDMSKMISIAYMFFNTAIGDVKMIGYKWPNITSFEGTFANNVNSKTIEIIDCQFPKLTNMRRMCDYSNFELADFSGLDTSNVTTMEALFKDNWYLRTFKLMYPVTKLNNTQTMFRGVIGLKFYYNRNYDYSKIPNTFFGERIPV